MLQVRFLNAKTTMRKTLLLMQIVVCTLHESSRTHLVSKMPPANKARLVAAKSFPAIGAAFPKQVNSSV